MARKKLRVHRNELSEREKAKLRMRTLRMKRKAEQAAEEQEKEQAAQCVLVACLEEY
jgi:hypothetical protein